MPILWIVSRPQTLEIEALTEQAPFLLKPTDKEIRPLTDADSKASRPTVNSFHYHAPSGSGFGIRGYTVQFWRLIHLPDTDSDAGSLQIAFAYWCTPDADSGSWSRLICLLMHSLDADSWGWRHCIRETDALRMLISLRYWLWSLTDAIYRCWPELGDWPHSAETERKIFWKRFGIWASLSYSGNRDST